MTADTRAEVVRYGWLERECQHARIEQEEFAKAHKRIHRRCAAWDRAHPLGDVIPEEPEWSIL